MDHLLAAYLARVLDDVKTYGVAVQHVDADSHPGFAYSVGLAAIGQPELLIAGLSTATAHALINDLALRVHAGTLRLGSGDTVHHLIEGYPVRLVEITDSGEHLRVAAALYGDPDGPPVPALQVVYPDAARRWPWEPGSTLGGTLLLGPAPAATTGREHTLT